MSRASQLLESFTQNDYNSILNGISLSKMAKKFNVNRQTLINFIVKYYGYTIKPKIFKTKKLTLFDIDIAKRRYLSGEERISEIAKDLGVNRKSLSRELKK